MATSMNLKIGEFDPDKGIWSEYMEQFNIWIILNEISDDRKTMYFLAVVGQKMFSLIKTLVGDLDPLKMSVDELSGKITSHL